MKRTRATRLEVEMLEDRYLPSVTAGVLNGTLTVTALGQTKLAITESSSGAIQVSDNGKAVGTYSNVTKGAVITLDNHSDSVFVNLGGNTLHGSLNVTMGNGTNCLDLINGTITGALTITGGTVTDAIVLGGDGLGTPRSFPAFTVAGDTTVNSGLGGNDTLVLNSGVTMKGNLAVLSANSFTLAAGSSVLGNASICGGFASNTDVIAGNVGKELKVLGANKPDTLIMTGSARIGSLFANLGDGNDTLNLQGTVAGNVTVNTGGGANAISVGGKVGGTPSFNLGSGTDSLTISGAFGAGANTLALDIDGGKGKDIVTLTQGSFMNGDTGIALGAENSSLTLAGIIGSASSNANLKVVGGAGNDKVTFASSLVLHGDATVSLGAGNDTFVLQNGDAFLHACVDGGTGSNTFIGNANASGLKTVNFQKYLAS